MEYQPGVSGLGWASEGAVAVDALATPIEEGLDNMGVER